MIHGPKPKARLSGFGAGRGIRVNGFGVQGLGLRV